MNRLHSIPRSLLRRLATAVTLGAVALVTPLPGQDLAQDEPPAASDGLHSPADTAASAEAGPDTSEAEPEIDPQLAAKIEKVDAAVRDWYDTLGKMRALQIRFHNGTGENEREQRREFRELEAESRQQHEVALRAAIELANYQPDGIPGIWNFLLSSVDLRGQLDWYESVADAAQAIQDLKERNPEVNLNFPLLDAYHGRALVTEARWEEARERLQQAIEGEEPQEVDFRLLTLLDTLSGQWEREKELRKAEAQADDLPRVLLETTRGDVVIELFEDQAPNTVANFITLVEEGFYDQLPFYTVIDHLFAVTGDPIGDGSGDAGYRIPDETDHPDARAIFRGSLTMAKIPDPAGEPGTTISDTASSQFMIAFLPLPVDRGQYTVFGRIIKGMPHVSVMTRLDPNEKKDETTRILPPDRILSAKVLRKRDHAYDVERIEYRQPSLTDAGEPSPVR